MPMRLWWTSLAWGAGIALASAIFMAGWKWIDNRHGMFHGPNGTHWEPLMHAALGWALPAFVYGSLAAWLVQLFRAGIKRLWARKGW